MAKLLGLDAPTPTQNAHTVLTERRLEAASEEDLRRELTEMASIDASVGTVAVRSWRFAM